MLGSMTVRGLAWLVLLAVLTGCGSASSPSPPSGVDELVIPTPSPDPADFTGTVDNPWFPLAAGTTWRYDVAEVTGTHRMVVTVAPGPTVDGVPTTARVAREAGRRVVDWYAQDDRGNVWWFGRAGQWRAGVDGAEAGLAMAATPRVGDGYRTGYAAGVVEDTARVVSVDDQRVVVEESTALEPGSAHQLTYEHGTGLVLDSDLEGAYRVVRLVP